MKPLYKTTAGIDIPGPMNPEAKLRLKQLLTALLGALGGLVTVCLTRHIFDLPISPASMSKGAVLGGALAGAVVLFVTTQMMALSPPNLSRGSVIGVLLVATTVMGVIASAGLLLIVRFVDSGFFQNRGLGVAASAVVASAVVSAISFLIAVPVRGFDIARTPPSDLAQRPVRGRGRRPAAKAVRNGGARVNGIAGLRRCPECGTLNLKAYPATDPEAVAKGLKKYVCDRGHEWNA
jgi:hypothetical protein